MISDPKSEIRNLKEARNPNSSLPVFLGFRVSVFGILLACLAGGFATCLAAEPSSFQLLPVAEVDGAGVYLHQVIQTDASLPPIRLCDAPKPGTVKQFTRAQVRELALATTNLDELKLTGAGSIRVMRRTRLFAESDALQLLTATLQEQHVGSRGELELRFNRAWTALPLPDEPITATILDLPTSGVSPNFIVRFELRTEHEILGSFRAFVQATIWRDIWVAGADLKRGDLIADSNVRMERRDVLSLRGPLADFEPGDPSLELAESIPAGAPLLDRSVRLRAVIQRGQITDALVRDGALSISMKVEALEDGVPGQIIRARNPQTRRDVRGQVVDAGTILVTL